MNPNLYIFGSVLVVSLFSFAGLFTISLKPERIERMFSFLIPLAIGALFGDAFFHLIPGAFENALHPQITSFLLVAGVMSFFILEKFLRHHHHQAQNPACPPETDTRHIGPLVLISDGIHNFLDGVIIGASYLVGVEIGLATTLAIVLHEIPQEIGDFGVLLYSGYSRGRALFFNFLSALTAILGATLVVFWGSLPEIAIQGAIPFAAGIFIYIAGSDLVPELHRTGDKRNLLPETAGLILGLLAMYLLLFLE